MVETRSQRRLMIPITDVMEQFIQETRKQTMAETGDPKPRSQIIQETMMIGIQASGMNPEVEAFRDFARRHLADYSERHSAEEVVKALDDCWKAFEEADDIPDDLRKKLPWLTDYQRAIQFIEALLVKVTPDKATKVVQESHPEWFQAKVSE